jgi:hypothetical protein
MNILSFKKYKKYDLDFDLFLELRETYLIDASIIPKSPTVIKIVIIDNAREYVPNASGLRILAIIIVKITPPK